MKRLRYVVTGCPRSGTVFMARFMVSVGIPTGHESVFQSDGIDGVVNRLNGTAPIKCSEISQLYWDGQEKHLIEPWLEDESSIIADSSYMSAPYLNNDVLTDTKIIHIVRNPMNVIHSICDYFHYFLDPLPTNEYESFIYRHIPELADDGLNQHERGALFYIKWNEMIEKSQRMMFFHRIEDDKDIMLQYFGKTRDKNTFSNSKINSFAQPAEPFTLDDLKNVNIKRSLMEMMRKYNYNENAAPRML